VIKPQKFKAYRVKLQIEVIIKPQAYGDDKASGKVAKETAEHALTMMRDYLQTHYVHAVSVRRAPEFDRDSVTF
jgi:hypothetical protein